MRISYFHPCLPSFVTMWTKSDRNVFEILTKSFWNIKCFSLKLFSVIKVSFHKLMQETCSSLSLWQFGRKLQKISALFLAQFMNLYKALFDNLWWKLAITRSLVTCKKDFSFRNWVFPQSSSIPLCVYFEQILFELYTLTV